MAVRSSAPGTGGAQDHPRDPAIERLAVELEDASAPDMLAALVDRFGDGLAIACSFQKEESVIVDMLAESGAQVRYFTLDTDVLFPESYEVWKKMEERYGIEIEAFKGPSLGRQAALHGDELWARDPDACCGLRKLEPLRRALSGADAWVGGLRREQSPERGDTPKLTWDARHGLWKASPLAEWTDGEVWGYIMERGLPYNPLHDRGYDSIGCTHCTRAGRGRAGRWAGTGKTECGLHVDAPASATAAPSNGG